LLFWQLKLGEEASSAAVPTDMGMATYVRAAINNIKMIALDKSEWFRLDMILDFI
jgi:hypothetical protein